VTAAGPMSCCLALRLSGACLVACTVSSCSYCEIWPAATLALTSVAVGTASSTAVGWWLCFRWVHKSLLPSSVTGTKALAAPLPCVVAERVVLLASTQGGRRSVQPVLQI
jgi:hypothetical protein